MPFEELVWGNFLLPILPHLSFLATVFLSSTLFQAITNFRCQSPSTRGSNTLVEELNSFFTLRGQ